MFGRNSFSHRIPAPAIGRKAMDAQDSFPMPFPYGQLNFNAISHSLFHDWFFHSINLFAPTPVRLKSFLGLYILKTGC
jgi:hypothetical protein